MGSSPRGPTDRAEPVTSPREYEQLFGTDPRSLLGHAVRHFFENGGQRAHAVRLPGPEGEVLRPDTPDFEQLLPRGLAALDGVEPPSLLCVPGETTPAVASGLQAEARRRRAFLVLDSRPSDDLASLRRGPPEAIRGPDGMNAALYFPWVTAGDPLRPGTLRPFPPCGFVAGVYARTDAARGVWRSPAGPDARLVGAAGVVTSVTQPDNPPGVNCLRLLPDGTVVVWGARTLGVEDASSSEWRYVPVRRTALMIEESVRRGVTWGASEPNDERLWTRVRRDVESLLHGLFRDGAFAGARPEDACFVRLDRTTMTQDDVDQGRLVMVVGIAPARPAEFVTLRIGPFTRRDPL